MSGFDDFFDAIGEAESKPRVIRSPLSVTIGKKKFYLNLNVYRNSNHFVLAKAKKGYCELMSNKIAELPVYERIKIHYTLYAKDKRKRDIANICSVVDKFFSDCLVAHEKIIDDCVDYIPEVTYKYHSIDKESPRIEIVIEEIT